jgi:hypothetical protein
MLSDRLLQDTSWRNFERLLSFQWRPAISSLDMALAYLSATHSKMLNGFYMAGLLVS